jgi:hypothetical protein
MTLCAAWIRHGQGDPNEELVFATDSRLRGGEAWDSGVKLFDLGREDCLLCFAGDTRRAYPLILHGLNSARFNVDWRNPRLDINDVLHLLCRTFTDLCTTIDELLPGESIHTVSAEAEFLFAGWSWRDRAFGVWRIYYSQDLSSFTAEGWHIDNPARVIIFLGDEVERPEDLLTEQLVATRKHLRGTLDMEPLQVLANMSIDRSFSSIGGALQVAKVYCSGHNEFFGIKWPSANGDLYFMGHKLNAYDAPPMRVIDPETTHFTDILPKSFPKLSEYDFGAEMEFVKQCYDNSGQLKANLGDIQRERLQRILKERAYRDFIQSQEVPDQQNTSVNEIDTLAPSENIPEV